MKIANKGKREKKVRRRDRFRRIKNKREPVYKSPAFLNRNIGVGRISESGIFEVDSCFTKAYNITTDVTAHKLEELIENWRKLGTECGILQGKYFGGRYLLFREPYQDMQEAMEEFSKLEQKLGLTGLTAEQRMEVYCDYMTEVLGKKYCAESYLSNTTSWKSAAVMTGLKADEKEIVTESGYFAVMAVRRFPGKITKGMFQNLNSKEYVMAAYTSVLKVSDKRIRAAVTEEYLGIDGILPRMKRKAPLLYDILKKEDDVSQSTDSFISVSTYFLLYAKSKEELKQRISEFTNGAEDENIRVEKVPLAELKKPRELKETVAMFGLMGNCQKRYGNFLPTECIKNLLVYESNKKDIQEKAYDVEEMRALFFSEKYRMEGMDNGQK